MLGFGFAGLARRWIVYPAALVWPQTLSSTALFRALHEQSDSGSANGWSLSRAFTVCCWSLVLTLPRVPILRLLHPFRLHHVLVPGLHCHMLVVVRFYHLDLAAQSKDQHNLWHELGVGSLAYFV